MTATTEAGRAADRELVVTRVLDAPRALVFEAWTDPARLVRWWGPKGFTTPACEMDVRPGGGFRMSMRSPEGTDHRLRGRYREIVPPERLVFTFAWEDERGKPGHETVVTVTFADEDGRTRLTLHQAVFETAEARDSHHEGWSECLDRLGAYAASAAGRQPE